MKSLLAALALLAAVSANAIPVMVFNFSQTDWTVNVAGGVAGDNGTGIPATWTLNGADAGWGWGFNLIFYTDAADFPFVFGENTMVATIGTGEQFTRTFTVNNPGPRPDDTIPEGGASVAMLLAGLAVVWLARRHIIAGAV